MTVVHNAISIHRYTGASTDTKPTVASPLGLAEPTVGSTFYEYDTDKMFITYDGTNWVEKTQTTKLSSLFGEPTLMANNHGDAVWSRSGISPYYQKSATGWLANIYGGIQTGVDWGACFVPVSEMKLSNLASAIWTYYMTEAEFFGINMVIWAHDPNDPSKRVEITQRQQHTGLGKAAGWNRHILNTTTTQFFYYGESVSGSGLTAGTDYTWAQFQSDVVFSTWKIYRISFENGWHSGGNEFKDAWLADIIINGEVIPLKPDSGGSGRIGFRHTEYVTGAIAFTFAPKTAFRLLNFSAHVDNIPKTGEVLTLTVDSTLAGGTDAGHFDVLIMSEDMFIGSRTSLFVPFGEGYEFGQHEEIDIAQTNGDNDDWGFVLAYQTVFP